MIPLAAALFLAALATAARKARARTWNGSALWLAMTGASLTGCMYAAVMARWAG